VTSELQAAYARGRVAENLFEIEQRFERAVRNVRSRLTILESMIETDPLGAHKCGFDVGELSKLTGALHGYFDRIARGEHRVGWYDVWSFRKTPGRKIRAAIEVTEMVALAYHDHFGKLPGKSKQVLCGRRFSAKEAVADAS
jgi:hypothetical protein